MKKLYFWGIGTFCALAAWACSMSVPSAPTASPTEPAPLKLATVTPIVPTLTLLHLTPDTSTPDTSPPDTLAIAPETASQVKLLATLHNDTLEEIFQLTWQPDGKALLVDAGGALTLLETGTWTPLWSIPSAYAQVRFTPDGRELLTMRGDEVQRRDAATGELLSSSPITPEGLFTISPDGRIIASTLGGGYTLTDIATGKVIRALDADLNSGPTADLAFSVDGSKVVVGSLNGDLQAWDAQSGQRTLFRPAVIPSPIYECETSGAMADQPHGVLLVICSYPANDYKMVYYLVGVYPASTNAQGSSAVIRDLDMSGYWGFTVNADRSRLAVFSGADIEIWSAFGGSRLLTLPGAAGQGMTFNPAEKRLLAVWSKRSIQIWDITNGQKVDEWQRGGSDSPPAVLAFSPLPASHLLAVGRADGWLELWDTSQAQKIASWQAEQPISALAFSPNGIWLAAATEWDSRIGERKILFFDPVNSNLAPQFEISADANISQMTFSADSRLLYSIGSFSASIYAWDVQSRSKSAAWTAGVSGLLGLAVRDATLAVVNEAGQVSIWENPPGTPARTLQLKQNWANDLEISPDKKQVLVVNGYTLEAWNIATGQQVRAWRFRTPPEVAYSPDGCTLASVHAKELGLMNTLQGEFYITISDEKADLTGSPAFSADGALLAAAFADGRVGIWGLKSALASSAEAIPPARCGSFSPPPTPTRTLRPTATPIPSITPTRTVTPYRTATPTRTPPPFTRTLSLTEPPMRGDDVLLLQERLLELGYTEVGAPDGMFGKMTAAAVQRFQQNNSLEADGYVGPKTWQKLFSADAKKAQ